MWWVCVKGLINLYDFYECVSIGLCVIFLVCCLYNTLAMVFILLLFSKARGLCSMHAQDLVHLDIKPGTNLLISSHFPSFLDSHLPFWPTLLLSTLLCYVLFHRQHLHQERGLCTLPVIVLMVNLSFPSNFSLYSSTALCPPLPWHSLPAFLPTSRIVSIRLATSAMSQRYLLPTQMTRATVAIFPRRFSNRCCKNYDMGLSEVDPLYLVCISSYNFINCYWL